MSHAKNWWQQKRREIGYEKNQSRTSSVFIFCYVKSVMTRLRYNKIRDVALTLISIILRNTYTNGILVILKTIHGMLTAPSLGSFNDLTNKPAELHG